MSHRRAPVQDPEAINQGRLAEINPPEALDRAAAFALGQWDATKRLAEPGQPPRRR